MATAHFLPFFRKSPWRVQEETHVPPFLIPKADGVNEIYAQPLRKISAQMGTKEHSTQSFESLVVTVPSLGTARVRLEGG